MHTDTHTHTHQMSLYIPIYHMSLFYIKSLYIPISLNWTQSSGFRCSLLIRRMGDAIIAMPPHRNERNRRMGDARQMGDLEAEWAILTPNGRRQPAEWAICAAE